MNIPKPDPPEECWDSEAARHCMSRNVDHRALGHYLRQQREDAGLSLTEMAFALKLPPTTILLMESGGKPWTESTMRAFLNQCQTS